jgi:hypothetical protein
LKTISTTDINEKNPTMGYLFVEERLAKIDYHSIAPVDRNQIKADGHVWQKSSIKKEKYNTSWY